MNYFLAKTEPSQYSISDLAREKRTAWTGVRNPQAVRAIREMHPGDRVYIYHSGGESAIVGEAKVVSEARPDPKDPKSAIVDIKFVADFGTRITLKEIKDSGLFDDWALVRQPRLSTMSCPASLNKWLQSRLSKAKP